ncbi:MAG: hypothetical protein KAQ69_09725 [Spirochaetales bacterium]|nr:hypothetical protein [Spirochaetales bacterium]
MISKTNQTTIPTPFFFCGLKHCGKTTLGILTAQTLSMGFIDADDMISKLISELPEYKKSTIREFYQKNGQKSFQEFEYKSIAAELEQAAVLRKSSKEISTPYIYALGGGACDNNLLIPYLKGIAGTIFYIKQAEKVLLSRILKKGIPPFLDPENPEESFHNLFIARSDKYKMLADHIIDISGSQPIEDSARMIMDFLQKL